MDPYGGLFSADWVKAMKASASVLALSLPRPRAKDEARTFPDIQLEYELFSSRSTGVAKSWSFLGRF